jgi:putative hemolysin
VRTYGLGYVRPYHIYKMWFYGDVPGTHMIRYNINGYYSNIVRFYVQGNVIQGASKPADSSMSSGRSNENKAIDPAISFCIKRGNIYENGKCTFSGGSSCDVWDFYRGNCILTGKPRR